MPDGKLFGALAHQDEKGKIHFITSLDDPQIQGMSCFPKESMDTLFEYSGPKE